MQGYLKTVPTQFKRQPTDKILRQICKKMLIEVEIDLKVAHPKKSDAALYQMQAEGFVTKVTRAAKMCRPEMEKMGLYC